MGKLKSVKIVSMLLAVVMLITSVPEVPAIAANSYGIQMEEQVVSGNEIVPEERYVSGNDAVAVSDNDIMAENQYVSDNDADITNQVVSGNEITAEGQVGDYDAEVSDNFENENGATAESGKYQYISFDECGEDVIFSFFEERAVPLEGMAKSVVYKVDVAGMEELLFKATVRAGDKLEIPKALQNIVSEKAERVFCKGRWEYVYGLDLTGLETTPEAPMSIGLMMSHESVSVQIEGNATIKGVDEYGYAVIGEEVSIEVLEPGYSLVMHTLDEKNNDVYTAMELDYDNCYVFTAEEAVEFSVVDSEQTEYTVQYASSRKAKINGTAGLKLTGLASSAQGYNEIVLNFTAVKNGTDGTENEDVYYEVKVQGVPQNGERLPEGSPATPVYYYIPKVLNSNTQSKSIQVNDGNLSANTAATYEFSVRMVMIDNETEVPEEDTGVEKPLQASLTNNTITKKFKTKNLYYEDKLGFTKKTTKIYNGQENVLAGVVKYSKNASYLHDLMAVAYDSRGAVCEDILCEFKNDNDELYVSSNYWTAPGNYKVVIYASIGESEESPQAGTMYQSSTSFNLTVQEGIYYVETDQIADEVGVYSKDVTMSVVPVGYTYWTYKKAAKQSFAYELKSVQWSDDGEYECIEPEGKVAKYVSVNNKGKLTIKRGYYVDSDISQNYIAVEIKATDFEGNEATATKLIQITGTVSVPTDIYLINNNRYYGSGTITANEAYGAQVIVLDQYGKNMNDKVIITPSDNSSYTATAYVWQNSYSHEAYLYVRKPTNITIKAVTKDGTKKSKTLKLKIKNASIRQADAETMMWNIWDVNYNGISLDDVNTYAGAPFLVTYDAPKGASIRFRIGFEYDGIVHYYRNWYGFSYKISGGKIKFDGEYWILTPTAEETIITFKCKAEAKAGYWQAVFVNDGWDTYYGETPKVTLQEGKIYSNKYTNAEDRELQEGWEGESYYEVPDQKLTYSYNFGSFDEVRVARVSDKAPYMYVTDMDSQNRTFTLATIAGNDLKAGSYKYTIAFYKDGIMRGKPTSITVKVNKASPVKVTGSYTLNSATTDYVALKCSTKDFIPDFETRLLNANVKGKANDFNQYFELVYMEDELTGENVPVIRFKSDVTAWEKSQLKGKTMTGYVKYGYYYGYSHVENVTAKVSIKVK